VIGNQVFRKILEREENDVREKYGMVLKKVTAAYIGHLTVLRQ
jgi:hypothetical protein